MSATERNDRIFGMPTNVVLPQDWMPVEGIAVIKCLDREGDPRLLVVATNTLNVWEAVGMLTALDVRCAG